MLFYYVTGQNVDQIRKPLSLNLDFSQIFFCLRNAGKFTDIFVSFSLVLDLLFVVLGWIGDFCSIWHSLPFSESSESPDCSEWRKLSSKELGIKSSMITKATKSVLNALRKKGSLSTFVAWFR